MAGGYVSGDGTYRDCDCTTQKKYVEILEFTYFVRFFTFNTVGENYKEKVLMDRIRVVVALNLDM